MKKRVAIVRGPNLNSWEMQNFTPLLEEFDIVGFTSYGHNFDISAVPFPVRKLFSLQQLAHARILRNSIARLIGGHHDLQGLETALRGFDIVHSAENTYYCTYQAARAKREAKFKLVVTVWENIPFLYHSQMVARNKKEIFDAADLFLPVSNRAKEVLILEGAPQEKIKVQMPGIDTQHFRPMSKDTQLLQKFGCSEEDRIVLFAGNLNREKGIFDLIVAFLPMLDRLEPSKNIKLLLAGKGRDENALRQLIRQLHLENNVLLIGSHSYATMPHIHNLADVFVLPSVPIPTWQEQFGYVLVESMACGKAVISTLSGSIPEVVADTAVLVPPNDFISLASAIENLLADDQKRIELGNRGRTRAETLFDSRRVAQQIKNHYESVLDID